jgi:hypothetical protein
MRRPATKKLRDDSDSSDIGEDEDDDDAECLTWESIKD